MAKRKSRPKPPPKKKIKLDICFTCPFCSHAGTVECGIKLMIGEAFCYICKEGYSTTTHGLSEPIDVYSGWLDECEGRTIWKIEDSTYD